MAYAVFSDVEDALGGSERLTEIIGSPADPNAYVGEQLEGAASELDRFLAAAGYEVPIVLANVSDADAQTRATAWMKWQNVKLAIISMRQTSTQAFNESTEMSERSVRRTLEDPRGLPFKRRDVGF